MTSLPLPEASGTLYVDSMSESREEQLTEAFVEAADTLLDDFDVIEFLQTVAGRCVQLLDVDAAGLMLADGSGRLHATAASSESAHLRKLFEHCADAGPCAESFHTGTQVVNADLGTSQDRWPGFGERARGAGYLSVHALPLRRKGTVIGALNLFSAHRRVLGEADVRTGQALADVATIGILAQRSLHRSETRSTQLQQALESRVTIEQAKGVLAERRRISVDEAFALLRGYARRHNLRLTDLARRVADGSCTAFDPAPDPSPDPASEAR